MNAANAGSGVTVHRSYLSILEQLTPLEVQILDTLYKQPVREYQRHAAFNTAELPISAKPYDSDQSHGQASEHIALALGNLARVGGVGRPDIVDGGDDFFCVHQTVLGAAFVRACHVRETERVRLDRDREASHDLNRLLDEPG